MKKSFFLLPYFIVVLACAQTKPVEKVRKTIRPGEVRWIEFPVIGKEAQFKCRGQEIKFYRNGGIGQTIVVESYFSDLRPFTCSVIEDGKTTQEIEFLVETREFKAEMLKVDPKKVKLSGKNEKRVWEEQQMLNKIYANSSPAFLFGQAFAEPLQSAVTSVYGIRRVFNKEKKGQHLGIDYRAAIGDKVPAANKGKVVYAGDLFFTGGTVIIDHGMDIFTVYGHLSKTLVNAGEMVNRGQLVGLSGNTGRTSGPHLHWGVKVQGQYIDGLTLIEETKMKFTE